MRYGRFLSTNGENKIITYVWDQTEGKPKGVVQIVHGMQEYAGRYDDFARFLNSKGFIVCGHDHIGHGRTALEYGMFGFFGESQGAKTLVNDSSKFSHILKEEYPEMPLFLLGHSMGSFITRLQVLRDSDIIDGYICMGSSDYNPTAPYLRGLASVRGKTSGIDRPAEFIDRITHVLEFNTFLGKEEPWQAWISHDKDVVEKYSADPFTQFYFTNQGYCDLMDLIIASTQDDWYYMLDQMLPVFVVGGDEDPVGDGGKGIKRIFKKLDKVSFMLDIEYKIYENMRHEILNEIGKQEVYNDILDWINDHINHGQED